MPFSPALPSRSSGHRRDRRGRGLRGPLIAPLLPGRRTPVKRFEGHVAGAVARLERDWHSQMARIEVRIEDVPMSDPASWEAQGVPLARCFGREAGQPSRVVLYRRPIEARTDRDSQALLVLDILVEQVAALLGCSPQEIDPGYSG